MSFSHGLIDRMLGCGRLVVESAGEHGQLVLTEIPHVEQVQATLFQLVEDEQARLARGRALSCLGGRPPRTPPRAPLPSLHLPFDRPSRPPALPFAAGHVRLLGPGALTGPQACCGSLPFMSQADGVTVRRPEGGPGIAEIVLDRPEAMNALSTAMAAPAGRGLRADRPLTAMSARWCWPRRAAAFCVGADLKERAAMSDADFMAQRPVFRSAFGGVLGAPAAGDRRGARLRARRRLRVRAELRPDRGRRDRRVRAARDHRGPGARRRRDPARGSPPRPRTGRGPGADRPPGSAPPRPSGSGWPTGWCRRNRDRARTSSSRERIAGNSPVGVQRR